MKFKTCITILVVIIAVCIYAQTHIKYWRGTEHPDSLHTHATILFGNPKLTENSRNQRYLTDTDNLIYNISFAIPMIIFAGGIVWFVREARRNNKNK